MLWEQLTQAVEKLVNLESRMGHTNHRMQHAAAECHLCARWQLAVIDVTLAGEQVFYPLDAVRDEIAKHTEAV